MKALITGITGMDGSYLAELLLDKGYEVHGLIRRTSTPNTSRINHILPRLHLHQGELSDVNSLAKILQDARPDEIYNLAAMSQVRISYDIPSYTGAITGLGFANLIEAVRLYCPESKVYQASSSEMFGKVQEVPQRETTPFYPRSPYGCAKAYAFYLGRSYREGYGMRVYNGILFNHECLTADTPIIVREDGCVRICRASEICPVPSAESRQWVPDKLEIWDNDKWSRVMLVTANFNDGKSDKHVHAVNCRGGYYEATANHISFLEGQVDTKTSQLRKGQKLHLGRMPSLPTDHPCSDLMAEFLGMMVADGWVCGHKASFSKNDDEIRLRAAHLWASITGGTVSHSEYRGGYPNSGMVKRICFTGSPSTARMIRKMIYDQSGLKKVPEEILNGPNSSKIAFLRAYNRCDGLKGGRQKTEFKSFTTDSPALALGLWAITSTVLGLRITSHPERREKLYYHLNINSPNTGKKGSHLIRPINEVKSVEPIKYTGWLYDFATESGTFSAGVGLTWVHNSPRRGHEFLSKKVVMAVAAIKRGMQKELVLGNLEAKRDIGYAKEYVEWIWRIVQGEPDDFVICTGETHSMQEFVEEAFSLVGLNWRDYVRFDPKLCRPAEVDFLQGDYSKSKEKLGFAPKVMFKELVKIMVDAEMNGHE